MPSSEAKKTKGRPMAGNNGQGNFTHITLLLDASSSMEHLKDAVVKVVDGLIEKWAGQSIALDDMTRLSVYQFSSDTYLPNGKALECIWYDTDITRLKTIQGRYVTHGATALIGSTIQVQKELALTPTIHGNHTFLFFAVTDGENNREAHRAGELRTLLEGLPENWTVAALVPHVGAKIDAARYGFPEGNIMVWDATSERGIEEAGERIAASTTGYLTTRSTDAGFRGTKSLFVGAQVDAAAVKAKLVPLAHTAYELVPVTKTAAAFEKFGRPTKADLAAGRTQGKSLGWFVRIDDFLNKVKPPFEVGKGYYQLFSADARRSEKVQGNKAVAIMDKKTSQIYVGPEARKIVGLPDGDQTVKPGSNKDYEIFIKSSSDNRQLVVGTKLLILT